MRKILVIAVAAVLIAVVSATGAACGKPARESDLKVTDCFQNAYGEVYVRVENAAKYVSGEDTQIEVSIDGGKTYGAFLPDKDNASGELGRIVTYNRESKKFWFNTHINQKELAGESTINIVVRLKATEDKSASKTTEAKEWKIKKVAQADFDDTTRLFGMEGTDSEYFVKFSASNRKFNIKKASGGGEAGNGIVQYMFYKGDGDNFTNRKEMCEKYDRFDEDSSLWQDYAEGGVAVKTEDMTGNTVKVLIRLKSNSVVTCSRAEYMDYIID